MQFIYRIEEQMALESFQFVSVKECGADNIRNVYAQLSVVAGTKRHLGAFICMQTTLASLV